MWWSETFWIIYQTFFKKNSLGGSDYAAIFHRIVMPIAYEFNPELVLISSDFDELSETLQANRPSSEIFGYLTHWLSALANGKMILFMKGECDALVNCVKCLLGQSSSMLQSRVDLGLENVENIQNVLAVQQKHWKSLKFNKMLPELKQKRT